MTLHIVKLCVGCSSVEELEGWIGARLEEKRARGEALEQIHITRMVPKRIDELLDGGSLYWVIKGNIQCRQKFLDFRSYKDDEGINRCQFVLEPKVIPTVWQPKRPFQGWRYLKAQEAPADETGSGYQEFPPELRRKLADLGLL